MEGGISAANLVVSNTIPISKEKAFQKAIKINPQNIQEIQEAVKKAYNMPQDEEMRKELLREFSMDSIINKHIKIYNNLLQERIL